MNFQKLSNLEKGFVKGVKSGDTLEIVRILPLEKVPKKLINEFELTLCGIKAPGSKEDEDYLAFKSRDFLRRALIGQTIFYTTRNNKRFGNLYLEDGTDVREIIVFHGWAQVIRGYDIKNPSIIHLLNLEQEASSRKVGLFSEVKEDLKFIKSIPDAFSFVESFKYKSVKAIVEKVFSGSSFKVYLPETGHLISVSLSGVYCPLLKKGVPSDHQKKYSRTAKFYTELKILNREFRIRFDGTDKNTWLTVTVFLDDGKTLNESLLREGLGKFLEWNAGKDASALSKAQSHAQSNKLRLWDSYDVSDEKSSKYVFYGKVVDIININTLIVAVSKDGPRGSVLGEEVRIYLSSIHAPQYVSYDRRASSFSGIKDNAAVTISNLDIFVAEEAKEYLRKNVFGRVVRVVQHYIRPEVKNKKGDSLKERTYSVVYLGERNLSVELVAQGFSRVHSGKNENRFPEYQELISKENRAKKNKIGIHGPPLKSLSPFTNLTVDSPKRIKLVNDFLSVLKLMDEIGAVVEKIVNGCKAKLWLPRQRQYISFVLKFLQVEKVKKASVDEPLSSVKHDSQSIGNIAYRAFKDLAYFRDVVIRVEDVDSRGNFCGFMKVASKDVGASLIEMGLARVQKYVSNQKHRIYNEYKIIEANSKKNGLYIWENYDEIAEVAEPENEVPKKRDEGCKNIFVVYIISGNRFFYQKGGSISNFTSLMDKFNSKSYSHSTPQSIKVGDHVLAIFPDDNMLYRARVKNINEDKAQVTYIDYGNESRIFTSDIKILPSEINLNEFPAQSHEGTLAGIRIPSSDREISMAAVKYLENSVLGKTLHCNVLNRIGSISSVVLRDPAADVVINKEMVSRGYARVVRRGSESIFNELKSIEDDVKRNHIGMWRYGDAPDSDSELDLN